MTDSEVHVLVVGSDLEESILLKNKENVENQIDCIGCLLPLEDSILETDEAMVPLSLKILRCTLCHKCRGILLLDHEKFISISSALQMSSTNSSICNDGWKKMEKLDEWRSLFVLSQILHNEEEEDGLEFLCPPITDFVKILRKNGEAIGFYSIKFKGTFDLETMHSYSMTTVDTIYIRTTHRRQGFGINALQDIRREFPGEKIGFSYPLTFSMRQVLWKHLKGTPEDRIRLWEITDSCGTHGNVRNLWLTLQREKSLVKNKVK